MDMKSNPLLLSLASSAPVSERLFVLLPERLFSPLASTNRRQYWALLCALHTRRFGPDAPVPLSMGFPQRDILADIEDELKQMEWADEEGDGPAVGDDGEINWPLRVANVFTRLKEAGWLRVERYGVREMVSMRPAVTQFLSQLVAFAEKGPVFLRGKVRSIDLNLQQLLAGEAGGDTLSEAAEQARRLLEHVASAGTNVRDLIDSFGADIPTADFVRQFWSVYIERFFIGDYSELKNVQDHPLARQAAVVDAALAIRYQAPVRTRLLEWYQTKRAPDDAARALRLFERDVERILELNRLDEHLARLDAEVRRANRKATAFLDYRIRSPRPLEGLVQAALRNVLAHPRALAAAPFGAVPLMGEERIAAPRKATERTPAPPLRRTAPTPEALARRNLRLQAGERRRLSALKVAAYLARHLAAPTDAGGVARAPFTAFEVHSVEDLTMLQFLMGKANEARGGRRVHHLFLRGVAFDASAADAAAAPGADAAAAEVSNGYVSSLPFAVHRTARRTPDGLDYVITGSSMR